ncbi:MAG TPA: sulfatase [Flavobacteriaceae bacterium]|nr:sulfatase [Flavobacteriaceae bacterium]
MIRQIFTTLRLLGFAFLALGCSNAKTNEYTRPNILFIMSDDHTSQAWGIYGGILKDYVHNTNIKRLASEGMVLNNAFCTNSICTPSRATILTGQYSNRNGVYTLSDALGPDSLNIAKLLKANGYQTAIIGKWHLKKEPTGFDYYNVLYDQGRYWDPILRTEENFYKDSKEWDVHKGFSTNVITDLSLKWLDSIDPSRPFMLMTHFKAVHEPFDYPDRFKGLYVNDTLPEPENLYDFSPQTTGRTFVGQKLENLGWRYKQASDDPESWWCHYPGLPFYTQDMDSISARSAVYQKYVKDFLRSGAAVDDNIGKILDYLEDHDLAENTVVIYTADQGYFLGEHGFFDKRLIYDESLRMPFVIRYPEEIEGGQRLDDIILNIDFAALMADYADLELPKSMQGRSFRQNLKGATPKDWRTAAYYRYWQHAPIRPGHFGIRNHNYMLAFFYGTALDMTGSSKENTTPAWEFYDLKKDPGENHNVYGDPVYKDVIAEMKKELLKLRENYGDTDTKYPEMLEIIKNYWD